MAERSWVYQNFSGGEGTDKKVGIQDSFANSQSLDFRKSPSQISVLPQSVKSDQGVVTDLIQNEVMTVTGRTFSIGNSGNIYTMTPTGDWSQFGSISEGTFGINYRQDQDSVYITNNKSVTSITTVSTSPTLNVDFYGPSQSLYDNSDQMGFNVNSNQDSGFSNTSIGTTISEANDSKRFFQTDISPVSSISVQVSSKGTGDWTLTVHDGLNNVLATSTVLNANISNNNWLQFNFSNPIVVNVGPNNAQTYHFHITSTVNNGSVFSITSNDMSSANMQLFADRLQTTVNGMHPMVTFQQFECIGNGRYLSVWEPLGQEQPSNLDWQRQKLTFPPGYEVCGLAVFNEYLVIATERITTGDATPQEGIIFYWDGLSDTYNYFTKIPEGSPYALHEYENAIWYVAGGNWYAITSVAATPTKVRRLPGSENIYTSSNSITKAYPYSATVRYGVHLLGWPAVSTNPEIPFGVYSWGRVDATQKNAFGYSYVISTGSQFYTPSNNLSIGMVKNFGNELHISWRDGDNYGLDVVDGSSKPSSFAKWESLIFDNGFATKQKQASNMIVKWLPIEDGVRIRLKYSINRGDWVYSEYFSNSNPYAPTGVGTNFARFDIGTNDTEARFYEIQLGIDIYCDETVVQPPIIIGAGLIFNDLREESLT